MEKLMILRRRRLYRQATEEWSKGLRYAHCGQTTGEWTKNLPDTEELRIASRAGRQYGRTIIDRQGVEEFRCLCCLDMPLPVEVWSLVLAEAMRP